MSSSALNSDNTSIKNIACYPNHFTLNGQKYDYTDNPFDIIQFYYPDEQGGKEFIHFRKTLALHHCLITTLCPITFHGTTYNKLQLIGGADHFSFPHIDTEFPENTEAKLQGKFIQAKPFANNTIISVEPNSSNAYGFEGAKGGGDNITLLLGKGQMDKNKTTGIIAGNWGSRLDIWSENHQIVLGDSSDETLNVKEKLVITADAIVGQGIHQLGNDFSITTNQLNLPETTINNSGTIREYSEACEVQLLGIAQNKEDLMFYGDKIQLHLDGEEVAPKQYFSFSPQ